MNELLAVLEEDKEPDEVVGLADAVAALLAVKVRPLLVSASEASDDSASQIVAAVEQESVNGAVLRGEPDPAAAFWDVIQRSTKPIVVAPFGVADLARPIARVLLPLDGTPETATAIAPAARRMLASGADLVATHVFDQSTVPAFWDQAAHSREPWTREFLLRNLPAGARLDLRHGRAAEEILAESEASGADLILLGWSRRLADDRARIVRLALQGNVPVMLVGTKLGPSRPG